MSSYEELNKCDEGGAFFFGLIIGLVIAAFTGIITWDNTSSNFKDEAVERGYAEWVLNNTGGGMTHFEWKENK